VSIWFIRLEPGGADFPFGVAKRLTTGHYLLVKPLAVEESAIEWLTGSVVLQGVLE